MIMSHQRLRYASSRSRTVGADHSRRWRYTRIGADRKRPDLALDRCQPDSTSRSFGWLESKPSSGRNQYADGYEKLNSVHDQPVAVLVGRAEQRSHGGG